MSIARRLSLRIVITAVLLAVGLLVMNLPALFRRQRPVLTLRQLNTLIDSVPARRGVSAPDSAQVVQALARVMDPEVDLSIVDMGLVESLAVDTAGNVRVLLILTTPECPFALQIAGEAVEGLKTVPGIRRIEVRRDPGIEWQPDRLTEEGRQRFREIFGDGSPGR